MYPVYFTVTFIYSVVDYEVCEMLRDKIYNIYILLFLRKHVVAFSCAFRMFQGKSLRMTLYFKVK